MDSCLKRQVPRLRDWNWSRSGLSLPDASPWNDKYLDYEIETRCFALRSEVHLCQLETTSTSITRLKHRYAEMSQGHRAHLKRQAPRLRDWNHPTSQASQTPRHAWNDKYLDYEIETLKKVAAMTCNDYLETTSTSITRLKLWCWILSGKLEAWLETTSTSITRLKQDWWGCRKRSRKYPWNDKYLDYEIETGLCLKVRLWKISLKRQVPRLRDWNFFVGASSEYAPKLETTSTSITRLKPSV